MASILYAGYPQWPRIAILPQIKYIQLIYQAKPLSANKIAGTGSSYPGSGQMTRDSPAERSDGVYMLSKLYWKQQRKRRNAERQQLAASRGWQFAATDPALLRRWSDGPFAKRGDLRENIGVVRGEVQGIPFTAFDFRMRTAVIRVNFIFRNEEWDTLTVWALHLPAALPGVECKGGRGVRQKILDRLEGTGSGAVRTGDRDFDARFSIYSSSPEFVQALLTPELRGWLREHKLRSWRISGSDLLLFREERFRIRPGKLVAVAEELADMVAHFPGGIWQRHGLRQTRTP
jgi:hypothetical protein